MIKHYSVRKKQHKKPHTCKKKNKTKTTRGRPNLKSLFMLSVKETPSESSYYISLFLLQSAALGAQTHSTNTTVN